MIENSETYAMWLSYYDRLTQYISFVLGIRLGDFKLKHSALKTFNDHFSSFGAINYEPTGIKYLLQIKHAPRSVRWDLERGAFVASTTGNGHSNEARDEGRC